MERPPTRRQREMLACYLIHGSVKEAAAELGLRDGAARSRLQVVYDKVGASSAFEAAAAIAPDEYRALVRAVAGRRT